MLLLVFCLTVLPITVTEREALKSPIIMVDLYINTQKVRFVYFNSLNIYFINVETLLGTYTFMMIMDYW